MEKLAERVFEPALMIMKGKESFKADVVIIGAGVVGLAIAYTLSKTRKVVLVDKNAKFGQETSSRNSEVIHSGIYYPKDSRKTEWCIKGRELIYSFCTRFNVPFSKCGKFVVGTQVLEQDYLTQLQAHSEGLKVPNRWVSAAELTKLEPLVKAQSGIYFPESGIVDSHSFMARLEQLAISQGAICAYENKVTGIVQRDGEWTAQIIDSRGCIQNLNSSYLINCAGLAAAHLSNQTLGTNRYQHRFCRGRYFNLKPKYSNRFKSLIYPIPVTDGLGVHVTTDLGGTVRLGPDVDWLSEVDYEKVSSLYDCNWDLLRPQFLASAKKFLPDLKLDDLFPGLIGIRPKLFIDGVLQKDFLLENHYGFIHLLGFESPGLTASLAIADAVKDQL